jgi:flagellin
MTSMINTNIASLSAQRNLSKSQDSLNTALQRLSSGLRINSAKDDAAGLAISTRMTSQINGMNQAIRNANDGISLAQTADSSLDEVTNNLQRIRDLALQAANGTNSADDRAALDVEVQQRLAEVNRIASQTTFNGINLLDGSFSSQAFQIGANANQTVTISSIASAKTSDLGLGAGTATGKALDTSVATSGITAGSLSINGTTVTTDTTTTSAKALAAAINGNATITASGVTAVATNQFAAAFTSVSATKAGVQGTSLTSSQPSSAVGTTLTSAVSTGGIAAGTLSLNGTTITTDATTKSAALLATAINAQSGTTGVRAAAQTTTTASLGAFASTNAHAGTYTLSVTVDGTTVNIENAVDTTSAGAVTGALVDAQITSTGAGSVGDALAAAGITTSGTAAGGDLRFISTAGKNITVTENFSTAGQTGGFHAGGVVDGQATAGTSAGTLLTRSSVTLTSANAFTVDGNNASLTGLQAGSYGGSNQTTALPAVTSLAINSSAVTSGITSASLNLNGSDITTSGSTKSARTLAANINAQAGTTGVYATAQTTTTSALGAFTTTSAATYTLDVSKGADASSINTVHVIASGDLASGGTGADVDTLLAAKATTLAAQGITFTGSAATGTLKFSAADGANLVLTQAGGGGASTNGFVKTLGAGTVAGTQTYTGTVKLTSANAITIADGTSGTAAAAGFATGSYGGVAAGSLSLNGTTITTGATTIGADALAAAINNKTATTGVTATALATDTGALGSFTTTSSAGYGLKVSGVTIVNSSTSTTGVKAADIDAALATTGTGTVGANLAAAGITFTGTAAGGDLHFRSATGANINVVETQGGTDLAGFGKKAATTASQYSSTVTLSSSNPITVAGSSPARAGLTNGTYGIVHQQGAALSTTIASNGLQAGDVTINGTTIVTDASTTSAKALATAINNQSGTTGVTATAAATTTSEFGKFSAVAYKGSGSYTLTVGGVSVANVADTSATTVNATYIDTQLASAPVATALTNAGISFTGTAAQGNLKFSKADGSNISVVQGGSGAGIAENLGGFINPSSISGNGSGTYTLTASTGGGSAVTIANVSDTSSTTVNAAYIDSQLANSTVLTNLATAGITFTGTAQAGTLKFTTAAGADVTLTQGGTATASLGSFTAINGTGDTTGTYTLDVSNGNGTVNIASVTNLTTTTVNASYIDNQLANSTVVNNLAAKGITFSGSASAGTLAFKSTDGTNVTVAEGGTKQGAGELGTFTSITSAAGATYKLTVGSVDIVSDGAGGAFDASATTVDAAYVDTQIQAHAAALTSAHIAYSGTAVAGNLHFYSTNGGSASVTEISDDGAGAHAVGAGFANLANNTALAGTGAVGFANLATGTSRIVNGNAVGFSNLEKGVPTTVNTTVGFSGFTAGVAQVTTSSVSLNSAGTISVGGNNPTNAGFTAGLTGANHKYTLTVGDGTTSTDLTLDLSKGAFGTTIKATDIASAVNSSAALQALKISAQIDANGKVQFSASDARNITLKESTDDKINFSVTGTSGFADTDATTDPLSGAAATAVTHMGQVNLSTTKDLTIAGTSPSSAGFTAGSFGGANVKSVDAANATLSAIDTALKTISTSRASLGAYQNRFASTVANLTANSESLTSARSRILDADFASETAQLTRGQILQQAGTAMLAQANQLPNGVLSLLRG